MRQYKRVLAREILVLLLCSAVSGLAVGGFHLYKANKDEAILMMERIANGKTAIGQSTSSEMDVIRELYGELMFAGAAVSISVYAMWILVYPGRGLFLVTRWAIKNVRN